MSAYEIAEGLVDADGTEHRVGEVIGWRAWKVVGDVRFPLLASVTHSGTVWHPDRWTYATCGDDLQCRAAVEEKAADLDPPGERCSCGLYAAKTRAQLVDLGYARYLGPAAGAVQPKFIGEVALAGKVIPGSQGWRAQKGRIARLYVPFEFWRYVDRLEEMYGIEAVLENTLVMPKEA